MPSSRPDRPLRLLVHGASGRMGRAILDLAHEDARFETLAAIVPQGAAEVGAAVHGDQSLVFASAWPKRVPDVVIDFSAPAGLGRALDYCLTHEVALVSGTTGIDAALEARWSHAATRIALLHAANFSLGMAMLARLLGQASAALPDWDLEIVEAHHGHKQDAPSGTALALGHAAAKARAVVLDEVRVQDGRTGARAAGSIGFAVVRGGDVVGEHQAWLLGPGERLELSHRATDRRIFARGALEAACWLVGQAPGRYRIDDLLTAHLRA